EYVLRQHDYFVLAAVGEAGDDVALAHAAGHQHRLLLSEPKPAGKPLRHRLVSRPADADVTTRTLDAAIDVDGLGQGVEEGLILGRHVFVRQSLVLYGSLYQRDDRVQAVSFGIRPPVHKQWPENDSVVDELCEQGVQYAPAQAALEDNEMSGDVLNRGGDLVGRESSL